MPSGRSSVTSATPGWPSTGASTRMKRVAGWTSVTRLLAAQRLVTTSIHERGTPTALRLPRATVRTTPDMSLVARRAAVGDRRDRVSTSSRTSSSSSLPRRSNNRRIVRVRHAPEEFERALEFARLQLRDEPDRPIEQPDERDERREPVAKRGQLGVVRVQRAAAAAASAALASRTTTIGSPSRSLRSAMTRPNHCQWSPTAR